MAVYHFPTSQSELIRTARADATQVAFAKALGVDRSCLSRYESETLGAPTSVLNHCLKVIAQHAAMDGEPTNEIQRALLHARQAVAALEAAAAVNAPGSNAATRRPASQEPSSPKSPAVAPCHRDDTRHRAVRGPRRSAA